MQRSTTLTTTPQHVLSDGHPFNVKLEGSKLYCNVATKLEDVTYHFPSSTGSFYFCG
jgi:hypothetical protein